MNPKNEGVSYSLEYFRDEDKCQRKYSNEHDPSKAAPVLAVVEGTDVCSTLPTALMGLGGLLALRASRSRTVLMAERDICFTKTFIY